ncbi:MAG TPA: chorismate-binding protein [Thermoanaerobaculia bacterium]|jgi:para-aminobenzoate synthetase component 1|nr:chorismate-binding protein [Thermoanaerobaculia bacterium]
MWSDHLSPDLRHRLALRLRAILPAPAPHARGAKTPLRSGGTAGPSPLQVAEELRQRPGFIWLDGGEEGHRLYSQPRAALSVRTAWADVSGGGRVAKFAASGFDLLEAVFAAWGAAGAGATLVGYLGYELGGALETLPPPPPDDIELPELYLGLYDSALLWDGQSWTLESTDAWRAAGAPDADAVIEAERLLDAARQRPAAAAPEGALTSGPVVSRPSRDGFKTAVSRVVERIGSGEIFQMNLCRRLETRVMARNLWPLYLRLRAASPAERGAFLDLGRGKAVLSISPERFLRLQGRDVESRPIKGTRARGADLRQDRVLARELLESEKDRAELTMIVDVARNDLGRVCETGSVQVEDHGELMTLPTVHHTVSTVRGRLRPDADPPQVLRATFPPASITGAPKIQAMTVIAAEEERRRGPAMGALGWISLGGDLDLAVSIRTAAAKNNLAVYHAGCGIVADSDPELELAESTAKARAFLTALGVDETP